MRFLRYSPRPTARLAAALAIGILCSAGMGWGATIKDGQTIAFLGDSITQLGASQPGGFVRLVEAGLVANGLHCQIIPAGVGGNMSNQMLKRMDKDVIRKKPDWVVVSCGVNDVNNGDQGVPLGDFKKNLTQIVKKAQDAGAKVFILTATPIGEQADEANRRLDQYNDFLQWLAEEKGCAFANPNAAMKIAVASTPHGGNLLTVDGVHPNPAGHEILATAVLGGLGLKSKQLAKARKAWLDIPGSGDIWARVPLTLRQYEQLAKLASQQKKSAGMLVDERVGDAVGALLRQSQ